MLLRISLIFAILAGIGTIVLTHLKTREHIQGIITVRNQNAKDRDIATTRYKKAETTLATTSNLLNQTKATLAKTEEDLNGTKQQLAAAQDNFSKTKSELAKSIEARKEIEATLSKWAQLNVTPEQVRELIAAIKKAQDAIAALEDEKAILARQVAVLDNRIQLLIGKEDYEVRLPAGTRGNVVAVDPKWNFVVLDIGSKQNILEGGVLMVHRNSQLVGKVRISEVQPTRSIASLMPGWKLGDVEEGDQVLYKE
jgi:hypothetical protein